MDLDSFSRLLRQRLTAGTVLDNPGGGTSTIVWCDSERVCYRRGDSRLYVSILNLYDAYVRFAGGDLTTRQLKDHAPAVFDSAWRGHNCHCTLLFLALQRMGLAGKIWGRGRAGAPFGATIVPDETSYG